MQIYKVGGAVRDALLGLPVRDRDWVVVGASPEHMLAQGYLPVGKDFPVFLHPQTHEEYALARTERKTAPGYKGFAFHAAADVTLEQDLARRDLTINAIAQHPDCTGRDGLVDPYQGQQDLQNRVLRHVTEAFREDPVRILRVARFAARFTNFSIAPATLALMREMVAHGEVDALVAERVWQELERGLMEVQPSRMLEALHACHALPRLLPEIDGLWHAQSGQYLLQLVDISAQRGTSLPVRFACLTYYLSSALLRNLCQRLRIPTECRELAEVVIREQDAIHHSDNLDAQGLVHLLERCDALRKPERFGQVLQTCECEARARSCADYPPAPRLLRALQAAQQVPTRQIAEQAQAAGLQGPQIGAMVQAARVQAVAHIM